MRLAVAGVLVAGLLLPQADSLPPRAERTYRVLAPRFERDQALSTVRFMQQYWRLAANPGFNASIDYLRDHLVEAGFAPAQSPDVPFVRVDDFPQPNPGWDYSRGTITIEGDAEPVLSRERDVLSLAINSFSTEPGGMTLRLVDVGAGTPKDFAGKDLKGAVVLGDAALGRLWQQAVRNGGAAGVISADIAKYIRPADPAAMSDAQKDVLQWGGIPYEPQLKSFGFKASWRAASRLRQALQRNASTTVRVEIQSAFYTGPNRTLVAEIPGRTRPQERIAMVAHVQEPGANDDASGCATLLGIARSIAKAIASGVLPRPERTLTFMWVDEIRGSQNWITSRADEARGVQYMFSLDMTGEDTSKTGGTFLIEKQADPSAVWERPSDPHSEWGASEVKAETLKGSLLNDLHIAVARRRSRDTGWIVKTNPYEGGSDHTAFASAGVPALLTWHFTDRYYHTNQDTTDKVSATEMENVGIAVGTSACFLASADEKDALATVNLLERAALARLAVERQQAATADIMNAWVKWYGEALDSVATLSISGTTDAVSKRIASAKRRVTGAGSPNPGKVDRGFVGAYLDALGARR